MREAHRFLLKQLSQITKISRDLVRGEGEKYLFVSIASQSNDNFNNNNLSSTKLCNGSPV